MGEGSVPDPAHILLALDHLERDGAGLEVTRGREAGRTCAYDTERHEGKVPGKIPSQNARAWDASTLDGGRWSAIPMGSMSLAMPAPSV
jgi:hypothetical protein